MTEQAIPQRVLLHVEDDDASAELFRLTLEHLGISIQCFYVADGVEAMRFLLKEGQYVNAPSPDVVVLDLNLPRKNGFELLEEMQRDPYLRNIQVVVLSTSIIHTDRERALKLGAKHYFVKEIDFDKFATVIELLCQTITY